MRKTEKTICIICVLVVLFTALINTASASSGEYSWYVKRNGQLRPSLDKEQELIYKYDGYYIDKKLDDKSDKKVIYLTFDLGYDNGNTDVILNTLNKNNITAAFFVLDNIILKNTDLVTKIKDTGHLVCNHTKNHKNLSSSSFEEISKNLTALERLFEEKTGSQMEKYFRFPEGKYSERALESVQKLGYKTIFWSFAYDDWDNARQPSPKRAIKKIIDNTHNGAVMLFHPTSRTNAEIFPRLIEIWKDMGYTFGTLDELVSK